MQIDYELDKKAIGERLQRERLRKGLTQDRQSETMGITSKYLSKVENGASAPSLPFIIKFSEVTGSDLNYLLRGVYAIESTDLGMVIREPGPDFYTDTKLSKKNRKICNEMMKRIAEVLEENNT